MLEINRIYNMDCIDGMKLIPDKSIDMILCDLPYGTTQCKWDSVIPFGSLWEQYRRIIKNNGVFALFGGEPFASYLRASNIREFKYDWYWVKGKATNFLNAKKQPLRKVETISIFCNGKTPYYEQKLQGKPYYRGYRADKYSNPEMDNTTGTYSPYESKSISGERHAVNTLFFATAETEGKTFHPTQKPIALCEYFIKTYTMPDETVLDNCMGSGTTAIACMNTGRNFIGFEWHPKEPHDKYFIIANKRISDHAAQLNILTEAGQ
jgi:DNA modification methylase